MPFPSWAAGLLPEDVNCMKQTIKGPGGPASSTLWAQSSFFCVFLSISILLVCLFKFNSVVQSIYSFSGFSTTQYLLICALPQSSEFVTSESQRPVMLSLGRNVQYQSLNPGLRPRTVENHWSHGHDWVKAGVRPQSDIESKCKMWQFWPRLGMCVSVLGQKWSLSLWWLTTK